MKETPFKVRVRELASPACSRTWTPVGGEGGEVGIVSNRRVEVWGKMDPCRVLAPGLTERILREPFTVS